MGKEEDEICAKYTESKKDIQSVHDLMTVHSDVCFRTAPNFQREKSV